MTLIATWLNLERPKLPEIWTVADTAITHTIESEQGIKAIQLLTEYGAKVLELSISCQLAPTDIKHVYYRTSIAFAYAGSSLVGLNSYATLSTLLGSLASPAGVQALPDYQSILEAAKQVVSLYTNSIMATVEICLSGFCPKTKQPFIGTIKPTLIDGMWNYSIDCQYGHVETLCCSYLGSEAGIASMKEIISSQAVVEDNKDRFSYWRLPVRVLKRIIDDEVFPTIDGGLQITTVNAAHFRYVFTAIKQDDEVRAMYRQIDIHKSMGFKVGECFIALEGIVL